MAARWDCPRCNATLGQLRAGALYTRPGVTVRHAPAGTVEIVCGCGLVKRWSGGLVIVSAKNRARLWS